MKLYVEMQEEEYERFKQLKNGDYIKPSGDRKDIYLYLEKSGFEIGDCATYIDEKTGAITATINFRKGNTKVIIVQENIQNERKNNETI